MYKKIIAVLLISIIMLNSSCLTIKIDKDSEPLVDFGTPIVGHFRNKDTVKGILYTVLFLTSVVGIVLFAPGENNKSIVQIDSEISKWITIGFAINTANTLAVSSIDTAVTYQLANRKIIDLNKIDWKFDPTGKNTKLSAINEFKTKQYALKEEESEKARLEQYRGEIEIYRQKLLDKTITNDELELINRAEKFKDELKEELNYYKISKVKEEEKITTDNATKIIIKSNSKKEQEISVYEDFAKIEYYKQKLIDGTIPEKDLQFIENDQKLKDILKNELGYYYVSKSMKKK